MYVYASSAQAGVCQCVLCVPMYVCVSMRVCVLGEAGSRPKFTPKITELAGIKQSLSTAGHG